MFQYVNSEIIPEIFIKILEKGYTILGEYDTTEVVIDGHKTKPVELMRLMKTVKQSQVQERGMVECFDHIKEIELDI